MTTLWNLLFYAWILFEIFIAISTRTAAAKGSTRDRGTQAILWIAISLSITVCEFIGRLLSPNIPAPASWLLPVSMLILALGLCIRGTAILTLGQAFSANVAIKTSQTIQRTGIYSVLRHPSYLGLLFIFLGIGLHSRNWFGLIAALLPTTTAVLYRIKVEEAALNQAFGPAYAAYSKKTKRLIPGLF